MIESALKDWIAKLKAGNNQPLAAKAFQNKQYTVAAPLIEKELAAGKITIEKQFYLGLSYLFQKQPNLPGAIVQLEKIIASGNIDYVEQANWFLALAYLQNDQMTEAKKYLEEIVAGKKWQHNPAKEVLTMIE